MQLQFMFTILTLAFGIIIRQTGFFGGQISP